ncbi:MAG: YncE family protein, partial [Nitrospirae bacterium]|nr:YncE family protein [Nitrospirota bacterium]
GLHTTSTADVASIRFTISASDMSTITRTVSYSGGTVSESFNVPNGSNRRFLVEALNSSGSVIYNGETTTNLNGSAVTLGIALSAVTTAQLYVLVSNADSDNVSVIDPNTLTVQTTLNCSSLGDISCYEPRNLAISHAGTLAYIPFRHSDNVIKSHPDVPDFSLEISDDGFNEPYAVAFTADDSEAWVVNKQGGGSSTGSVSIIDTSTQSVTDTIDDICFSSPEGIAIANGKAYVANRGDGTVCVVNVASRTVSTTISTGGSPRYAVATPNGNFVYVSTDSSSAGIKKIRTSDDTITATIAVRGRNLAVMPDGTKVYVATQGNTIEVINVSNNSYSTITFTGAYSIYGVAILSDSSYGFATDEDRDVVYVFNPSTDTVVTTGGSPVEISVGSTPRAIAAQ